MAPLCTGNSPLDAIFLHSNLSFRTSSNYLTRPDGHVTVEIQDADGRPRANFSADDCDPLEGDEIAETVTWKTAGHGPFAGRPVRVRFEVKDADLFSFRFR